MNPPILYTIEAARPQAHLFRVTLTVEAQGEPLRFALPAWIPGSYLIREFARHIVSMEAKANGRRINLVKVDKQTWQAPAVSGTLSLNYEVYAWDFSVRAAHLDLSHGFFNGSSVFLRVVGREALHCLVDIRAPKAQELGSWRVATSLREHRGKGGARRHGFGLYEAADYDELIDHPVQMGAFMLGRFEACGTAHEVAVTGRVPNLDMDRLCSDLARVCSTQIRFFEPRLHRAPMNRYVFLVTATGDGYGGLEHRASTALLCSRNDLPRRGEQKRSEGYRGFLGLASHEYFHTWNVKRIKPAAFVPYPFDHECHTSLLWIFEGFTSYYDDLLLARSGLMTAEQYLKAIAKTIGNVLQAPGRLKQSVADSSFDAWTKYYRPDENSPNAIVSYYTKGALVALCLDLHIRSETRGKCSLDDVMRALWREFGRDFYEGQARGLGENDFVSIAERAVGVPLARPIADLAHSTRELPLAAMLRSAGIEFECAADGDAPSLGIKTKAAGDDLVVATAYDGGAAQAAGISGGDVLVALDGLRIRRDNLEDLLGRRVPGERVDVHVFRRDELSCHAVRLAAAPATKCTLTPMSGTRARAALKGWLGAAPQARRSATS